MITIRSLSKMAITSILIITSFSSNADALSDAFDNIATSTVPAGVYESKSRVAVSLGSFSARVPQTSFSLFSYTPPRLSAGCGGIDAHFGGFSFVNGIDFQQLVANISQNALGLVIHLAIQVGCEPCRNVLADIQEWARVAASMSVDSCLAAKSGLQYLNNAMDLCTAFLGREANADSESADPSEAAKNCNNEVNSWDSYQKQYGQKENPSGADAEAPENAPKKLCRKETTNDIAWCILTQTGLLPNIGNPETEGGLKPKRIDDADNDAERRKIGWAELFRALAMQEKTEGDTQKETLRGKVSQIADPKTFTRDFYNFAICGTKNNGDLAVDTLMEEHCATIWAKARDDAGDFKIPTCASGAADEEDYNDCRLGADLAIEEWAETRAFFDAPGGMLGTVIDTLMSVQSKVQNREELEPEEMAIIAQAPVPLYQLFNLSSVYPALSEHFLGQSALLMADMIVTQYFTDNISQITRKLDTDNVDVQGLRLIRESIQEFSIPLKNGKFEFHGDESRNNKRAFRNEMLSTIEVYQRLLVREIADSQMGANISASKNGYGIGGTN